MAVDEAELLRVFRPLRARRDHAAAQVRSIEREMGRAAKAFVDDEKVSKSAIARALDVSHTHVADLINRAEQAGPPEQDQWLTPWMSGSSAARYLETTGRSLRRVIAGYTESDVFIASGLPPVHFDREPDWPLVLPHLLNQLDDGTWLAIEDVRVGYEGTGPSNAYSALRAAGVAADLAGKIAHEYRFSVTDFDDRGGGTITDSSPPAPAPRYPNGRFRRAGQAYVMQFAYDELSDLKEWVDFLDDSEVRPGWMDGDRIARVFLDDRAATAQGFNESFGRSSYASTFDLIIEQGDLQLWVPVFAPDDAARALSDEMYEALGVVGLYPKDIAARDQRSWFWRYVDSRLLKQERPPYVDLSRSGTQTLRSVPIPAAELS